MAWASEGPSVPVPQPLLLTALLPNGGIPERPSLLPAGGPKLTRLGVNVRGGGVFGEGYRAFGDYLANSSGVPAEE